MTTFTLNIVAATVWRKDNPVDNRYEYQLEACWQYNNGWSAYQPTLTRQYQIHVWSIAEGMFCWSVENELGLWVRGTNYVKGKPFASVLEAYERAYKSLTILIAGH